MEVESLSFLIIFLACSEIHEAEDMGIDPATADLVAARLREICLAETGKQRSHNHNRSTELCAPCDKVHAHYVFLIDIFSLECIHTFLLSGDLYTHALKQDDKILHIKNLRYI